MPAYLPFVAFIAAAVTFFTSQTAFWWACSLGVGFLCFNYWMLRRLPPLQLEGLSPSAVELLAKYNSAWVAPGLTRTTTFAITAWQLLFAATALYFAFHSAWASLVAVSLGFLAVNHISGAINPTAYIRMKGLGGQHDEIVEALMNRFQERNAWRDAMFDKAVSARSASEERN